MSTWLEVAPLQVRRTVSTPLTLRPSALSVICAGVGVGVAVAVAVAVGVKVAVGVGVAVALAIAVAVAVAVGVNVAVAVAVGVGVTVGVGVGVGKPACAQYLPPVLNQLEEPSYPPQTIILLPVPTAV